MTQQEMSDITCSQFESKALALHHSACYLSLLLLTCGQECTHTHPHTFKK